VSLLSSPRRRRRLGWVGLTIGCAGVIALAVALLTSRNSSTGTPVEAPPTSPLGSEPSNPATARARTVAAAAVRPLTDAFINDVLRGRNLDRAHALLNVRLRKQYSLADWRKGRHLPISVKNGETYSGSSVVSFSGPRAVGLVAALDAANAGASDQESVLVAIRFAKTNRRWLIDYLHQGHSSTYVGQGNYSPPGFLPGSHEETFRTWSILIGGFLALVGVVAFLDFLLSRGAKSRRL
jgi:hypothetical protein